ncbi:MAG: hypothetical protein D4R73_07090, partial [Deltaproteobacteria bacterium]
MAKVLLYEDEEAHAMFILTLLVELGYEVIWTKNKEEVEASMKTNDFELFILDIIKFSIGRYDIDHGLKIAQSIR